MTWLSVKEHELPMDKIILVKNENEEFIDSKYGLYILSIETRGDGSTYNSCQLVGISAYDAEELIKKGEITHFQVIE